MFPFRYPEQQDNMAPTSPSTPILVPALLDHTSTMLNHLLTHNNGSIVWLTNHTLSTIWPLPLLFELVTVSIDFVTVSDRATHAQSNRNI